MSGTDEARLGGQAPHLDEERVADLAVGDGTPTAAEQAHLDACPACAGLLTDLEDLSGELAEAGAVELVPPPAQVRERVLDRIHDDGQGEPADRAPAEPPVDDADRPREPARRARRLRPRHLVAAALVGLLVGGVATVLGERALDDDSGGATTLATAVLVSPDSSGSPADGTATVERTPDDTLGLRVQTSDLDTGDGYLEVWLLHEDGRRMISLGVLPAGGQARYPVSQRLLDAGYATVDISREPLDEDPAHSGTSLLTGSLGE